MSNGGPEPRGGGIPATSFVPEAKPDGTVMSHPLIGPPPRPGLIGAVGRFELLRQIGEGGMGVVFLARDTMPPKRSEGATQLNGQAKEPVQSGRGEGALVALKLLPAELAANGRAVEYFLKEAEHAQRLRHPNILPVLESSGQAEGAWMVMRLAEGGSLAQLLEQGRPLAEDVIIRVATQIAGALEYAHGRGIIHRDLKPRNILFDGEGRAYLSDFGLARSLLNDVVLGLEQSDIAGTPQYQSPTAARGEHGDTRDDIYSFGAVLYEMLTGSAPYCGRTREEVLQQIREGPPRPILSLNPKAPVALVKIAEWAMARDLRDRYAHIGHVREDLELVAKGEEPKGPHGGTKGGLLSLLKRPKVVAGVAVVLLVCVGLGLTWLMRPSLRLWRRIELPDVHDWSLARCGRLSGITEPIFHVPGDGKLLSVSAQGQILAEWALPVGGHGLGLNVVEDINGDGSTDAIVHWRKGEESIISVVQYWRFETARYAARSRLAFEEPSKEEPATVLAPIGVFDLEHDGRFEVLAHLTSGKSQPRGVCCVRFPGEELLWTYHFGPWPLNSVAIDLDGDGMDELLVGSNGVNNGVDGPDGTDDKHSYLFAFGRDGKLIWKRCMGELHTMAVPIVTDLNNDGKKDILVWVTGPQEFWAEHGQKEIGPVVQLDYNGEELRHYDTRVRLHGCVTADLDGDGKQEVLLTDRLGYLHVLDSEFQLVRRVEVTPKKFTQVMLEFGGVGDMDGDKAPEIVVLSSQIEHVSGLNPGNPRGEQNVRVTHESVLVVLNARLEPLGTFAVLKGFPDNPKLRAELADVNGDGRSEVLVFGPSLMILRWDSRLGLAVRD
ncbi:MAG: protein kinase [Verrucomicrobia bacterium]|nr:protein kinase [Verrucomicrobiota bacterium]